MGRNAEQEMKALDDFNEKKTVIADRHFADKIKTNISAPAAGDTIFLTSYKPNELKYKSHTSKNNFAVFSEIYFPWGWHISHRRRTGRNGTSKLCITGIGYSIGRS